MSDPAIESYVVKLVFDKSPHKPCWVMAGTGRGLGEREDATEYPNLAAADDEAEIWKALPTKGFSVFVEPA